MYMKNLNMLSNMNFKPEITGEENNIPIHTTEHDIQFHKNLQRNNRKVSRKHSNRYSIQMNNKH